ESLVNAEACSRYGWANIEEPTFGEGPKKAFLIWNDELIPKFMALKKAGYYVVLIAHVKSKTVPGITTDSYPQYMPNLRDDIGGAIVD
ncbi:hypothetical protein Q6316_28635, partial [Klebsiella pneumoniae]|uniref:hypothetical protein n=1 Tax=Klebsiella pneumoniae TaxID=573 RepID=UPI00272F23B4